MPLQKQALNINFAQGLETKADPWQVEPGKMLEMVNTVFNKTGMLTKRNGYEPLATLPKAANHLATYRDNLIAIKNDLLVLSPNGDQWFDKGDYSQVQIDTVPLVRKATSQNTVDTAINGGLACSVWTDADGSYYYQISNATTGVTIQAATALGAVNNPRVFAIGVYFVISFVTGTGPWLLQYFAVPIGSPNSVTATATISAQVQSATAAYDGVVGNNQLYFAFNASDGGGAIRVTAISTSLAPQLVTPIAGQTCTLISLAVDSASAGSPKIWLAYQVSAGGAVRTTALSLSSGALFNTALAPTQIVASGTTITNITCVADSDVMYAYYQEQAFYTGTSGPRSDLVERVTCTLAGTVGTITVVQRGVGLASKAFILGGNYYFLAAYGGVQGTNSFYQPSYFLIKDATSITSGISGGIVSSLSYANGAGYATTSILPSPWVFGSTVYIGYLRKTLIYPVNKDQNANSTSNVNVYAQQGINLVIFSIGTEQINTVEAGGSLLLTGGLLWMYDGEKPVEHGFNVYPEDITLTATAGGSMTLQQYFYQVTYEWTDNSGQLHRSSPSVPQTITLSGGNGSVTLKIPTYRLTYKTNPNPVRIVIYRWSVAQQSYYQVTSVTSPTLNDNTVDSVTYVDTLADASILGNQLIYTTGGVLENTPSPAVQAMTLFKSRLFLIDGEDRNLLWYSKPILDSTPVEMTDLQTIYVAPTISSQGSTGDMKALVPLDDKLIIFKANAIYYLTGNGPDATGTNNDYGDPAFITATAGCSKPNSIVNTPNGIMFQSDKGIWILGRDFSTNYIGAPVEAYNNSSVISAVVVPGTNQVRFTLDTGQVLVYDYFFNQWSTFEGIPALSSVIYQDKHTFIDKYNRTFKEKADYYLDGGGTPVTMRFKSAWFKMAGLQGFQRAYYFMILGKYISPHKLSLGISYDYNPSPTQITTIVPENFSGFWGDIALWGNEGPWGGKSQVEQWRIFLTQQKCQSFQITMQEFYDPFVGPVAGAGLTLSGLNLVVGVKKGWNTLAPRLSAT
jgi:hypothetical protein